MIAAGAVVWLTGHATVVLAAAGLYLVGFPVYLAARQAVRWLAR